MTIGLLLAAAAGLSEPDLGTLLHSEDYPVEALRKNRSAAAYVEIELGANGRISRCRLLDSVGDSSLAESVCRLARLHQVEPARLPNGVAGISRFRILLRIFAPGTRGSDIVANATQPADVELTVKALPGGPKSLTTTVVAAVGTSGELLACQAAKTATDGVLTQAACQSLKGVTLAPVIGSSGLPVPYVTMQKVSFTAP